MSMRADDQLLVSFPKAGNTWVRYFLYRLLSDGRASYPPSMDAMDKVMPEFANHSFFEKWAFPERPRIVKTHQSGLPFLRKYHAVLIVRDPRDISVSYYYYLKGLRAFNFSGEVGDVLRHPRYGIEAFMKHYTSWRDHVGLVLRYEDLKRDPELEFGRLISFLRLDFSESEIRAAISEADFSTMRKAQASSDVLKAKFSEGHQFVRSGRKGQWSDLFSVEDVAFYERIRERYNFNLYE